MSGYVNWPWVDIILDNQEAPLSDERHQVGGGGVVFGEGSYHCLVVNLKTNIQTPKARGPGGQSGEGGVHLPPVYGEFPGPG